MSQTAQLPAVDGARIHAEALDLMSEPQYLPHWHLECPLHRDAYLVLDDLGNVHAEITGLALASIPGFRETLEQIRPSWP